MTQASRPPQMNKEEFSPGSNLQVRTEWLRKATPLHQKVLVVSPARLHTNVFDFTKMRCPLPGGGGIGVSVDSMKNEVVVAVERNGDVTPPAIPTVRHLLSLFNKLVDYEQDNVSVNVGSAIPFTHGGFGSNVTLNTAVFWGLNALFGTPFSATEIYDILTSNYVENTGDSQVYWGLDTGVGEAALIHGGFVWIDEQGRYIGSLDPGTLYAITASGDYTKLASARKPGELQIKSGGVAEKEIAVIEGSAYQEQFGERLQDFLEHQLKPAFLENETDRFLHLGWKLNEIGTFQMLARLYDVAVLDDFERTIRMEGCLYGGMSSAGPAVFALVRDLRDAQRIKSVLEQRFSNLFADFRIGTVGTRLRTRYLDSG